MPLYFHCSKIKSTQEKVVATQEEKYSTEAMKGKLAVELMLSEQQVHKWFFHRRQKEKDKLDLLAEASLHAWSPLTSAMSTIFDDPKLSFLLFSISCFLQVFFVSVPWSNTQCLGCCTLFWGIFWRNFHHH